jgi:hypothetical protein
MAWFPVATERNWTLIAMSSTGQYQIAVSGSNCTSPSGRGNS